MTNTPVVGTVPVRPPRRPAGDDAALRAAPASRPGRRLGPGRTSSGAWHPQPGHGERGAETGRSSSGTG